MVMKIDEINNLIKSYMFLRKLFLLAHTTKIPSNNGKAPDIGQDPEGTLMFGLVCVEFIHRELPTIDHEDEARVCFEMLAQVHGLSIESTIAAEVSQAVARGRFARGSQDAAEGKTPALPQNPHYMGGYLAIRTAELEVQA
jgi:hypothetical protein